MTVFKCLTPTCQKLRKTRGLCPRCYHQLRMDIRSGVTTWEEAEKTGRCLPAQPKKIHLLGAPPNRPFF